MGKSEATGDRLEEAKHINRSLSALGDVMAALAAKDKGHVPYRNSKLTQLLQDSLCGQAKAMMFIHVSPEVRGSCFVFLGGYLRKRWRGHIWQMLRSWGVFLWESEDCGCQTGFHGKRRGCDSEKCLQCVCKLSGTRHAHDPRPSWAKCWMLLPA